MYGYCQEKIDVGHSFPSDSAFSWRQYIRQGVSFCDAKNILLVCLIFFFGVGIIPCLFNLLYYVILVTAPVCDTKKLPKDSLKDTEQ